MTHIPESERANFNEKLRLNSVTDAAHMYSNNFKFVERPDGTALIKQDHGPDKKMAVRNIRVNSDYFVFYEANADAKTMLSSLKIISRDRANDESKTVCWPIEKFLKKPIAEQVLKDLPEGCVPLGIGHVRIALLAPSGDVLCIGPVLKRPACPLLLHARSTKI